MLEASRRGQLRQQLAESRNWKPYRHGSIVTHTRGSQVELAVAKYLHEDIDPDWTLAGDRRRGSDVAGFHVRSSWYGDRFMWRDHDYTTGTWIFASTQYAPKIELIGWLSGKECPLVARNGWIRAGDVHELPDWGLL